VEDDELAKEGGLKNSLFWSQMWESARTRRLGRDWDVRSASRADLSKVEAWRDRQVRLTKKNESSESAVWTFQPQTESVERSTEEASSSATSEGEQRAHSSIQPTSEKPLLPIHAPIQ
jgi:hypothetical protein